jgi:neurobeachin-like protein 1/2
MLHSLQGGNFDQSTRAFTSVSSAWDSATILSSDVKELIPELFYQPEIFRNSNRFDLGDIIDAKVNDVTLPPWANGSPEEFVRLHRAALESDYVSANLHRWFDLIFGFQQRGPAAIAATNVFFHLTYNGVNAVDKHHQRAFSEQILQFGQIPVQLLTTPHPQRESRDRSDEEHSTLSDNVDATISAPLGVAMIPSLSFVWASPSLALTIDSRQCLSTYRLSAKLSTAPMLLLSGVCLGEPLEQSVTASPRCYAVSDGVIYACGFCDHSVRCFSSDTGQLMQCVYGHSDVVLCLAVTECGTMLSAGSRDSTISVWEILHPARLPMILNSHPRTVLVGHVQPVISVAIKNNCEAVLSVSADSVLLHSINGDLIRSLRHPTRKRPFTAQLASDGTCLVYYCDKVTSLAVFTINGQLIADVALSELLMDVVITPDGCHCVHGGLGRSLVTRSLHDLVVVCSSEPFAARYQMMYHYFLLSTSPVL